MRGQRTALLSESCADDERCEYLLLDTCTIRSALEKDDGINTHLVAGHKYCCSSSLYSGSKAISSSSSKDLSLRTPLKGT